MGPLAELESSSASVPTVAQSSLEPIDIPTGAGNFFPNRDMSRIVCEEVVDGL